MADKYIYDSDGNCVGRISDEAPSSSSDDDSWGFVPVFWGSIYACLSIWYSQLLQANHRFDENPFYPLLFPVMVLIPFATSFWSIYKHITEKQILMWRVHPEGWFFVCCCHVIWIYHLIKIIRWFL